VADGQWARLQPLLEPKRRADGRGRPWRDTRQVLIGVLWVQGTGTQWRELPVRYPHYQTCHRRFQQWVRNGVLERVLRVLAKELEARARSRQRRLAFATPTKHSS
jgi:transposase